MDFFFLKYSFKAKTSYPKKFKEDLMANFVTTMLP